MPKQAHMLEDSSELEAETNSPLTTFSKATNGCFTLILMGSSTNVCITRGIHSTLEFE